MTTRLGNQMIDTIQYQSREIDVVVLAWRPGYIVDDQGYRQPTHNLYVMICRDQETGQSYFVARDNGDMTEVERTDDESDEALERWLMEWDDEWVEQFRRENILPQVQITVADFTPDWLRSELDRAGMTQAELARETGISQATITKWLSGERTPSRLYLKMVEDALQTTAK